MSGAGSGARAADPCPVCGRPVDPRTKPFCSTRCADIDLGRWLGERYVIPAPDDEEADPHPLPEDAGRR